MATTEPPADQAELFRRLAAGYDQAIRRYQVAYDAMLELSTDLARVAVPGKSRCLDFGTGTGAERWKEIMSHRGADDEFVTAATRQVDTAMHRRTVDQLLSLLEQAGFRDIEQPFQALHTASLLGRK